MTLYRPGSRTQHHPSHGRQSGSGVHHGAIWLFFAALTFILLHPIIFSTGTYSAGYDWFHFHWNFWFIRDALSHGTPFYQTDYLFAPHTTNLAYHTLSVVWFPIWAVLEPLIGTFGAVNAVLCAACTLNGAFTYYYLRSLGVPRGLALLGGAAFQTLPTLRYFLYNTHLNLITWFWLPIHLWLWGRIVQQVNLQSSRAMLHAMLVAIVMGVGLWGMILSDLQFGIFLAFVLVPVGLWSVWHSRARMRLIGIGLLAIGIGVALLWFAGPLPYILAFRGTLAPGMVDLRPGIAFPDGYLFVRAEWWIWNKASIGAFFPVVLIVTVGYLLVHRRGNAQRWLWLAVAIVTLLITLGPIAFPYRLLHALTNGMFGMPWRFAPVFAFAVAVCVGLTWRTSRRAASLPLLCVALLALFASARIFMTAPLDRVPPHFALYDQIGTDPESSVLLEVPTAMGTGEVIVGDLRAVTLQYFGIFHHKRMVNSFVARAPIENFWSYKVDDPLVSWLGQRRPLDPVAARATLQTAIREWPLGYIVVHQDLIGRDGVTNQEILSFLNAQTDLLCPWLVEYDAVVYRALGPDTACPRLPASQNGTYRIDVGETGDELYIGQGWHRQEDVPGTRVRWAGLGTQAELLIALPVQKYTMTLTMQAYQTSRPVTIQINDTSIVTVTVQPDSLQTFTITIPAELLYVHQVAIIALNYGSARSPADQGIGVDSRPLAIMVDTIAFE